MIFGANSADLLYSRLLEKNSCEGVREMLVLSSDNIPFVSCIIVMYNEEHYVEDCLLSLLAQDYPQERYEIIVVDGGSNDRSRDIVEKHMDGTGKIRLIDNPERILAAGWNKGIKEARGSIVVRPDAHSYVSNDFITKSVRTLNAIHDAVCVGGRLISVHRGGVMSEAIASVLSSRFGVGNSCFRVSNKPGYVDTVAYGAYRKEIFGSAGLFNEKLQRNQDLEMHSRIRALGGRFYFNPEIKSYYYTRATLKGFVKQALGNGYWNIITLRWSKTALSLRHLVPCVFVLTLLSNAVLSCYFGFAAYLLAIEVSLYFFLSFFSSLRIGRNRGWFLVAPTFALFFVLHISYGIGSLAGMVGFPFYE